MKVMGIVEETGKMIEKKIYEAAEQARSEDQMTIKGVVYNSKARYNINTTGPSTTIPTGAITGGILGASVDASREQWLEKTQHMRVVALNEACEIAKTFIGYGEPMATREITSMASLFAKFLVDNEA